jgi:phosphatidylglycerol:prolipoprotein diacylglycerol transferase
MEHPVLGLIFTAAAYVVGSVVFFMFSLSRGFARRDAGWILFGGLAGGILGAKVARMLFAVTAGVNPSIILAHPDGRTILGGILFGWAAVEFVKKRLGVNRSTGDGFALALSLGEAIGRIGCFFNPCCYGAVCSLPWAVFQVGEWRHPSQLYSAAISLTIFLTLCYLRKRVSYEGDLFRIYLLLFGISRFFIEFVRERTEIHFGLSVAQWVSLEIAVSMILAIAWHYRLRVQTKGAVAIHERESV